MLSPVLSGEKSFEEIVIHGDGWYVEHGVTLYKGHRVVAIDRKKRTVTSDRGVVEPYDKFVIATGSMPIVIPVPGHKLAGVLTYRDLDDVNAMLLAAKSGGRAVVIGGGLLGLEAAVGLQEPGMEVSVVHLMPTLMERQLDPPAGFLLAQAIEARGVKVYLKANTKEILGTDHAHGPRPACAPSSSTTGRKFQPIWSSWRSEFVRARRSRAKRVSASIAASSSAPTCASAIPTFSRSANAPRRSANVSA
jgi:nitrite reductase (NADH) large subunit